jgi:hypothetical protein
MPKWARYPLAKGTLLQTRHPVQVLNGPVLGAAGYALTLKARFPGAASPGIYGLKPTHTRDRILESLSLASRTVTALFALATPSHSEFDEVITMYFGGRQDSRTIELLGDRP